MLICGARPRPVTPGGRDGEILAGVLAALCCDNTRFGGTNNTQYVETRFTVVILWNTELDKN
jgi:hypothetical protein